MDFLDRIFKTPAVPVVDVDLDAATILSQSVMAVRAVLDRRMEMDRTGDRTKPLVVLVGETHSVVAHPIFQILMMDGIRSRESLAVARELNHAFLEQVFDRFSQDQDSDDLAQLKEEDHQGEMSLCAGSGFIKYFWCDHSKVTLEHFLYRNKIPVFCTDACTDDGRIDIRDTSTAESMRECFGRVVKRMKSTEEQGMQVRNHHMTGKIEALSRQHRPRILMQICGAAHINGYRDVFARKNISTKYSLGTYLKERAVPFMALPLLTESSKKIIPAQCRFEKEWVPVRTLPESDAVYDPDGGCRILSLLFNRASFRSRRAEMDYLNPVLERVGLGHASLSESGARAFRDECKARILAFMN